MMRQLWKLVKQGDLLEHEKAVLGQALEVSVVEPELKIILSLSQLEHILRKENKSTTKP